MCMYVCVCMFVCMCVCMFVDICVCMYVMYVCMYMSELPLSLLSVINI